MDTYVKNGNRIFHAQTDEEKAADEAILRAVLEVLEGHNLTQSSTSLLMQILHKVGLEEKRDAIESLMDVMS
jgi:hypothetical protein